MVVALNDSQQPVRYNLTYEPLLDGHHLGKIGERDGVLQYMTETVKELEEHDGRKVLTKVVFQRLWDMVK